MHKIPVWFIGLLLIISSVRVQGAEDPDELYRNGRFAEAEKAYASLDMDHPKDIRYRYNRGCAAYQNSNYQESKSAFSSALKRSDNKEIQFKALYNLGNTAFKQGDFASASACYKKAIILDSGNKDVRYNLELALREIEKQKKKKDQKDNTGSQEPPPQGESPEEQSGAEKEGEEDRRSDNKQTGPEKEDKSKQKNSADSDREQRPQQESQDNLSGDLQPRNELPDKQMDDEHPAPMSSIDKRKAEALLDNIKEDRSRFMRFQTPEDKKNGVGSGKEW